MDRKNIISKNKGFTLTELLVVMVLAGIVMAAIYSAFTSQTRASQIQEEVAVVQQNLRVAMYHIVREIRMAGFDRNGSGNFGFVISGTNNRATNANNIYFTVDRDRDGVVASTDDEQIAFRLNSGNLQKWTTGGTWQPVAGNIDSLIFSYLDGNENPVTPDASTIGNIRLVDITLSASKGGHSRQLSTRVCCRNLVL